MIYAHNMISGYLCLQGSVMFHLPMLISMAVFIRIPPEQNLLEAFGTEYVDIAFYWYWFALSMHAVLAAFHLYPIVAEELSKENALRKDSIGSVV